MTPRISELGPGIPVIVCLLSLCLCGFFVAVPADARVADVQFDGGELALAGDPGATACGEIGVSNVGDEFLDDICFESPGGGGVIPHDAIEFIPPCMSLAPGETETLTICVDIPPDLRAGIYETVVSLHAAGGTLYDAMPLRIIVNCVPGLDILDDAGAMSGNEMVLAVALGESGAGAFEIANVGNCELTGIEGPPPTGPPLIVIPHIPPDCAWGETVSAFVEVRLVEPGLPPGSYETMFTVTADGGATDYFWLVLDVMTVVHPASWSKVKALYRAQ
ncbi:hypothetical protein KAW64_04980 [bacterium]|nr:hypothetical protein [bacterium]